MGRPRKPSQRRVDDRSDRGRVVVPLSVVEGIEPPGPPAGLLKVTREWWEGFWASDHAAAIVAETDFPAVVRLARLMDRRERYEQAVSKRPFVEGSKQQPVANPLARLMPALDAEIRQLEDRFGLNPRARAQLGVTVGQYRKTLDDLTANLDVNLDDVERER